MEHRKGRAGATKNKQPRLAYYEGFNSCSEAFKREMQFKNGKTRKETIEKLIESFSQAKCQGFSRHQNLISVAGSRPCNLSYEAGNSRTATYVHYRSISCVLIKGGVS